MMKCLKEYIYNEKIETLAEKSEWIGNDEAPYVNSIDLDKQLSYTNIRYMVGTLGEAIGTFLCGVMYFTDLRYMFGLSAIFILMQLILAYILIYQKKKLNIEETKN